jgi:hypothetical protein
LHDPVVVDLGQAETTILDRDLETEQAAALRDRLLALEKQELLVRG